MDSNDADACSQSSKWSLCGESKGSADEAVGGISRSVMVDGDYNKIECLAMVVLTGDVHHMTLGTADQARLPSGHSEITACEHFLEIVTGAGIKPTIFMSGKVALEEEDRVRQLFRKFQPEIGGHTYYCHKWPFAFRVARRLLRTANYPSAMQRFEVGRTIKTLARITGETIVSWRNHAYQQDQHTAGVLAECGISSVSNEVGPERRPTVIHTQSGWIVSLPINTPPDHENLHPDLPHVGAYMFRGPREWMNETLRQVERNEADGVPSVILAHPACMMIEDKMASLDALVASLSKHRCVTMRELAQEVLGQELSARAESEQTHSALQAR